MNKDQILAHLPRQSLDDLKVIQAVCSSLINARTGALPVEANGAANAIFNALVAVAGVTLSLERLGPKLRKAFDVRAPGLENYFNMNFPGWDKSTITQQAFLRSMFGLLRDQLKDQKVSTTYATLIVNSHALPRIINAAYPNYLESGLGELILDHFTHKPVVKKVADKPMSKGTPFVG